MSYKRITGPPEPVRLLAFPLHCVEFDFGLSEKKWNSASMSNYLKPLKAGKPRAPASSSSYERIGEDEKPFLAEGVSHNPRLQLEDQVCWGSSDVDLYCNEANQLCIQRLKRRIRWLKFVSRVLAFLIR